MDERISGPDQHARADTHAVNGHPHPTEPLRQRDTEVTSLVDVDSPDDFAYEGQLGDTIPEAAQQDATAATAAPAAAPAASPSTARQAQGARGSDAWTTVDNPDDFE
ncbi:hypothetical protein SAMN05421543_101193 [Alicyclobacillus macrosporangiidus]|uniref:Uncharacterized protein n=1 Tax=Alicyclobacillus macrosporangiidus TaxID=392015 RepID=A0A1I7FDC3_9BACL|nr:hypothetical protein SAMN05421543_101193 [Alicyclobacillus macrosporangiidus]